SFLIEIQPFGQYRRETCLIHFSCIGSLLHFHHVELFYNLESVASGDQKDYVSRTKQARLSVLQPLREKINPDFALPNKQRFLGVGYLSVHWVVCVSWNDLARWVGHTCKLLG